MTTPRSKQPFSFCSEKVKGYSNQAGARGHASHFHFSTEFDQIRYNYTSNKNVHVGMAVANKVRNQVWT